MSMPNIDARGFTRRCTRPSGDAPRRIRRGCGIRLYVEVENVNAQATYRELGMQETHYRLYEEEF